MTQELVLDRKAGDEINTARILYAVHGLTFFFSLGLLSILPVIFNYIKRPDAEGTIAYSHHTWMIRSFWWYAAWMTLGWVLVIATVFTIGWFLAWPLWVGAWLWKAYRLIRGFIDLNSGKAMPA